MFGWSFEVSAAPGVADCLGGMRGVRGMSLARGERSVSTACLAMRTKR